MASDGWVFRFAVGAAEFISKYITVVKKALDASMFELRLMTWRCELDALV
jgi:hypothetical protein